MIETFYATTAQICFALLGLWWVVVQFKYDLFMRDPVRRRTAYNISLYFILPGAMSLVAVLASAVPLFWQASFSIVGAVGLIEAIQLIRKPLAVRSLFTRLSPPVSLVLYVLIIVFALVPGMLRALGVTPLHVEGILLGLIIVLGIQMAWNFFTQADGE